jgi:hypothetical protein
MFEAVRTDLVSTISLKRSTQNFSYPQARRHPIFERSPDTARRQSCSPATRPGASLANKQFYLDQGLPCAFS